MLKERIGGQYKAAIYARHALDPGCRNHSTAATPVSEVGWLQRDRRPPPISGVQKQSRDRWQPRPSPVPRAVALTLRTFGAAATSESAEPKNR